jgi:hypothetical protein
MARPGSIEAGPSMPINRAFGSTDSPSGAPIIVRGDVQSAAPATAMSSSNPAPFAGSRSRPIDALSPRQRRAKSAAARSGKT